MILIKGMEMPTCCDKCFYRQFCDVYGKQVRKIVDSRNEQVFDIFNEMRLADCPLVALPEHGEKCCGNCRWCQERHYEEEGEQPYIKRKCTNKYGLTPNYSVYEYDYCSRWETSE